MAQEREQNLVPCAVYLRVSTDHADQKRSMKNQENDIPSLVERSGRGYVVRVYSDEGITGTKAERPAFQQMIEDAKAGAFEFIITKSISRFARNVTVAIESVKELKLLPHPVGVYFIEEGFHTLQPGVDFTLGILALVAEQESKTISDHIMATFNAKINSGVKVSGSAPFGYDCKTRKDGTRYIVPNKEADIIRQIFAWYLTGLSTVQISQKLREDFGLTKRPTSVAKILHNESYIGDMRQGKQRTRGVRGHRYRPPLSETVIVKDAHEAIISREDFERVQQMMRDSGRGRHSRDKHALSGLITCGRCGSMYQRHHVRDGMAWVCSSYQKTYNHQTVECKGKKFKTTHEKTIMDLYTQGVYFLGYITKSEKTSHYTYNQKIQIERALDDIEARGAEDTVRRWVQGITIGTEKIDRIIRFSFIFGVDVIFETDPQDTRYTRAECTVEMREAGMHE